MREKERRGEGRKCVSPQKTSVWKGRERKRKLGEKHFRLSNAIFQILHERA